MQVTVVILDRPRHKGACVLSILTRHAFSRTLEAERCRARADIIQECRDIGCRIRLISDGDVAAAVEVAKAGSAADIMFGIGGTPEGKQPASAESPMILMIRHGPMHSDSTLHQTVFCGQVSLQHAHCDAWEAASRCVVVNGFNQCPRVVLEPVTSSEGIFWPF